MKPAKQKLPKTVRTIVEIARLIPCDQRTIRRWLQEDGNPGKDSGDRFVVKDWIAWAEKAGKRAPMSATEWKAKLTEMQARREELKLKIESGAFIPASEAEVVGSKLGEGIRTIVTTLHLLAPSLAGMDVPSIEKMLRQKEDELMASLHVLPEELARLRESKAKKILAEGSEE